MRLTGAIYAFSLLSALMASMNFSAPKASKDVEKEENFRLLSIFAKNKYGFNTRFMSDFDLFLSSVLNETFVDASTLYYDDEMTATEIADQESGLAGQFSQADVQGLLHDKSSADHAYFKSVRSPDRVASNYPKGDALSCYKILPKQ